MRILFIHQNFPGQYLHLAQHMRDAGHQIIGLGESKNIKKKGVLPGVTTIGYPTPQEAGTATHHYLQSTEAAVRRGQAVARALFDLKAKNLVPDVISLHPGWGEGFFVRDVFPDIPILMFCEYYFRAGEADLQFDPENTHTPDWNFSVRVRNTPQVASLLTANATVCPTRWQASRYPALLREGMRIIHDGIDTAFMCPDPSEQIRIQPLRTPGESRILGYRVPPEEPKPGSPDDGNAPPPDAEPSGPPLTLSRADKVITYVARNLEPYRGTHVFLRALEDLQRLHPDAHILIVGSDGVSYSRRLPEGQTYKARLLQELEGRINLSRIHFLGRIAYPALRAVFRVSSAHVYLTYPFVLSWSALEAMACGCLLVASRTAPVEEAVTHGKDGLLVDFFDRKALVDTLDEALREPQRFASLREEARRSVIARFSLEKCLKKQAELLEALGRGEFPAPS